MSLTKSIPFFLIVSILQVLEQNTGGFWVRSIVLRQAYPEKTLGKGETVLDYSAHQVYRETM